MVSLKLKSRQWIVDEHDRIIIGEGRQEILENIEKTGSMNKTAKIMKMSYKGIWSKIKATEKYLSTKIVDTDRTTGSKLTKKGKELLEKYRVLKERCLEEDNRNFDGIFGEKKPIIRKKWETEPRIVSIVGYSGTGKTTLLERLIPEFVGLGYRIGTIKHDAHEFEMDRPGKDSWRHKRAGASTTIISSHQQIGMVADVDHDYHPEELKKYIQDVDIILAEGYKRGDRPKLEVFRPEVHGEPICRGDKSLIALVSDVPVDLGVPRFTTSDSRGLVRFLIRYFDLIPNSKHLSGESSHTPPSLEQSRMISLIGGDILGADSS